MPHITREDIADRITELLIEHFSEYTSVNGGFDLSLSYFQKVVRNGVVQVAEDPRRAEDERLVLYRSDVKGNEADIELLNFIYDTYFASDGGLDLFAINLIIADTPTHYYDLAVLVVGDDIIEINNGSLTETFYQDNVGQFVNFIETSAPIDSNKAEQILDTNIYELLPTELTKQQRINRFFREYNDLKPPAARDSTVTPTGAPLTDLDGNLLTETWNSAAAEAYHHLYDISGAPINEEENRYITWLNVYADTDNVGKSLEILRNDLNDNYFLQEDIVPEIIEERPEYKSRSEGYLKIRTLNQAIIVRNEESSDIGLIGIDSDNPLWHDTGFTITMWVRFLDKVNGGTLFNFGNPLRKDITTPSAGFMLETFVVERSEYAGADDGATHFGGTGDFSTHGFYLREDVERFVRLVVRDKNGVVRDSHVGNAWKNRINTTLFETIEQLDNATAGVSPFNYTRIPIDLREWYFIVATFNPDVHEDPESTPGSDNLGDPDFWRWNITTNGDYTSYSELGAKCKVEIISRTDLLRARGFKE